MERETAIFERISQILSHAQVSAMRSVNTVQVVANWLIGKEIVEEEQQGDKRAQYGKNLLKSLSQKLNAAFGRGYSVDNLERCRRFFLIYPDLISATLLRKSNDTEKSAAISQELTVIEKISVSNTDPSNWEPGQLNANLSWSHYLHLIRIKKNEVRAFYEIEALKNHWAARELERQINSLLFERLAKSKDKEGLLQLACKGQEIQTASDIFKDPVVIEFLGLPESPRLVESELEQALINNLQSFLLELGRGFAFVSRQERISLDGDHFYVDLVLYHVILKCYVLIELKVGKLTHQDLGQLQFYVNYYDQERCTEGDQPTLGLILCTDKNDAVVRYTLAPEQQQKIFASRYQLHLPTEAELQAELQRELRQLSQTTGEEPQ